MSQSWSEISSGIYGNEELSKKARMISATITRLDEAVDPSTEFHIGKKSGDSVGFRLVGRISGTADTALGEFTKVPLSKPPIFHGTGTVSRRAQGVSWTGSREDLDRLDVEDTTIRALREHAARTRNKVIYDTLVAGRSFTYVATGAATQAWLTDGTVAGTAAADLTLYHLRRMVENAMVVNMPPADGDGNYFGFFSPKAYFDILQDSGSNGFVDVKKYDSGGAAGTLRNEIGKVANIRISVDNADIDNSAGATAFGSGFVLGEEACKELQVYPMHFRSNMNLGGDFGNQKAIAWQSLEGFKVPWDYTSHGQGSIIHYTSA